MNAHNLSVAALAAAGLAIAICGPAAAQAGALGVNGTIPRPNRPYLANNRPAPHGMITESGRRFAMKAYQGSMAEVRLGQLAEQKSNNPAVLAFARRMVRDHSKADRQLRALADDHNFTLPSSVEPQDQAEYDRLSGLNGAAFDRAYMRMMVDDHRKDIDEFQRFANSGRDSDVRTWAGDTLPTLRTHLQLAEDARSQVSRGYRTYRSRE